MAKNLMAMAAAIGLAACAEAGAQDSEAPQAEPIQVAALTQGDCLRLQTQTEIVACMREVSAASQVRAAETGTEIAIKAEQRLENAATIADQEQEASQIDTTIEGLTRVLEIASTAKEE